MSHLVVITFDNAEEAGQVPETLRSAQQADYLSLDDSAIVVKDQGGQDLRQEPNGSRHQDRRHRRRFSGPAEIGGIFFPVAGLLVGKSADLGIDRNFVKEVSRDLKPGTSAIFFIVREGNPHRTLAALKPYKGTVRHTSFPPAAEETMRRVLSKRIWRYE